MNENPKALYVSGASPILLQTARANVYKSGSPEKRVAVAILLDSGSQGTHVTAKVKESLGLTSNGQQTILVKTFGSTEENTQTADIVDLSVITEQGDAIQLTAYVVPFICEPLQRQSITQASADHEHLHGMNLADYSTGKQNVMVDILVGSDQYWNLQSWTKLLGHLHFFAENRPSSISPSPLPLSMLYQWAESALSRSHIDQGEGGRHFAQTRPSRASKTERLVNICHIFRLSQGLLSRIV